MEKEWDLLLTNATLVTCEQTITPQNQQAFAIAQGKIAWIGAMSALKANEKRAQHCIDLAGKWITPGLIDCHTHLVYAGNRAHEFELRLQGVSYTDIAKQGGGIQATVTATREADFNTLFNQSVKRALTMRAYGVTTVEIKSGYGLDLATELKILAVAAAIQEATGMQVKRTFLGAHIIPPDYRSNPDTYVTLICETMLPRIAAQQLADAVDVFCETIAFDLAQTERVFQQAKALGLAIKCHAEQLSNSNSAALAARYQALSVDHLEYLSAAGVEALAKTHTVAVLLPGAFYFLKEKQMPPIALLRQHQVPIAIATDCNPGTSPILSLPLIMQMACTLFGLTPEEAFLGVTKHAAQALGIANTHGTLTVGKTADLAVWEIDSIAELTYYLGANPLVGLYREGINLLPPSQ